MNRWSRYCIYKVMEVYEETTWVWCFTQWMQHEVHGWGKNAKAEGWGIFAATVDRMVHSLCKTSHPCGFAFIPHFICEDTGIFRSLIVLVNSKLFLRTSEFTQLNSLLWRYHNVYLWCHNGALQHTCSKYYEYFILESCTPTACIH